MGHRRRRSRDDITGGTFDDVADLVSAAADAVRNRDGESAAARRRQEKEERRRREEAQQRRQLIGTGAGLLAGGLAATAGLITVGAVGVGLLVGGVVIYGIRAWDERSPRQPRLAAPQPRPALRDPEVTASDPRAALIRSVLTSAMAHIRTVDARAAACVDLETAAVLTRIAAIGSRICQSVAAQTSAFDAAQRVLTYHAEKAAQLADMSVALAAEGDGARLSAVRAVLGRMERLFEETEGALKAEDGRELDLELRLIDQALDEDLRARSR
jgi:hypothetical protein